MTIKAVLFDLDGTLLGNDMMDQFLPNYFDRLTAYLGDEVPPQRLVESLLRATDVVVEGRDTRTNEEVFSDTFYPLIGKSRAQLEARIVAFYHEEFPDLRRFTHSKPEARRAVQAAFDLGYDVVIATNPLFPAIAIRQRLEWAGVADFPYRKVTSYENSHYAKPHLGYFREILAEIGCEPEEALVVGDEAMDMVAGHLGCTTFLIPRLTTQHEVITPPPTYQGSLADLVDILYVLAAPGA